MQHENIARFFFLKKIKKQNFHDKNQIPNNRENLQQSKKVTKLSNLPWFILL